MKIKIIIYVKGGVVAGAYFTGLVATPLPEIIIVDTDGEQVGEETVAETIDPEPIEDAPDIVKLAIS